MLPPEKKIKPCQVSLFNMRNGNAMRCKRRSVMIFSVKRAAGTLILILAICCGVIGVEQAAGQEYHVEGYVSAIKNTYLYLNGQRYFLAPDVKFTLDTEYGRPISGTEVFAMQKIDRARIHIRDNKVDRITILQMDQ
jgi:hypothetical protein